MAWSVDQVAASSAASADSSPARAGRTRGAPGAGGRADAAMGCSVGMGPSFTRAAHRSRHFPGPAGHDDGMDEHEDETGAAAGLGFAEDEAAVREGPARRRVAIAGASGLIGGALARSLRADGHTVVRLVRREARAEDEARWDPERGDVDTAALAGCDTVVNLAGAGIGDHRWTDAYKRTIRDSRVLGTAALADAVASLDQRPEVFVCGSAIGYYGDTGERAVDESAGPGEGFLPDVCVEWEDAAGAAAEAGVRTVFARTGLVVSRGGGAWGRLFPLFKAGLGGRIGNGRQYWSFIALHDHIAALRHLIDTSHARRPLQPHGARAR
ncbi:NAD dependent epimerase/dehydratase, partial [Streptomyces sp. SPB78]